MFAEYEESPADGETGDRKERNRHSLPSLPLSPPLYRPLSAPPLPDRSTSWAEPRFGYRYVSKDR